MKKIKKIASLLMVGILLEPTLSVSALTKNETVYTNLNYDGTIERSSITSHLLVDDNEKIEDETQLKEILNINGKETFTQNGNKLLWNSFGKDIFYRGTLEKDLPIEVKVEYFLDGEKKDAKEMLGKSGEVKIQFTFQNNDKRTVKVNGSNMSLYTPYVITSGMIINSEDNQNIEINNGKVIDSGTKNMVIGIASPGMYENFQMKEFKSLDEITITYKTKKFSQGDLYIVATPKLLEEADLTAFTKIKNMTSQVNALQTSMNQIEAGAKKLEEGSSALESGSTELMTNLKSVSEAIQKLESGSIQVEEGLKQILTKLDSVSSLLSSPKAEGSLANLKTLKTKNTETINLLVSKTGMNYETLLATYQSIKDQEITDANMASLKSTCELIFLLSANNEALTQVLDQLTSIQKQVGELSSIITQALTKVTEGAIQVSSGLTQVKNGISKLYEGSKTLNQGTKTLNSGTKELSTGITKFNKEGIQTLSKYSSKINGYSNKIEALVNISKNYNGYASNNAENTTFVYMIKKVK